MSCQICGRRSAPGTKLCADCRAARKRAYDATITQPLLAMAGAGTVSRTLARLRKMARHSDESYYKLLLTIPLAERPPVDYKQVELIGNSVPPEMVSLLVRLNTQRAARRSKAA